MKNLWLAIAGCCITIAAVLIFTGRWDGAFVVAVIGMIAWFFNYRSQVQQSLTADDATTEDEIETDKDEAE